LPKATPGQVGIDATKLAAIDSIAYAGIEAGAFPGAVVLAAKDGKIFYEKAFGKYSYDTPEKVTLNSVYDLASVTKICATTISIMKLVGEGKVKLNKTLGTYLPWVKKSDKKNLTIENILLHQAGLVSFIPFSRETIDKEGRPLPGIYQTQQSDDFNIRVAEKLYMKNEWVDTIYKRILDSKLGPADKYIYSDNDFIFLGKIVEAVSGMPLNEYVAKHFYIPMGLTSTGFMPREFLDTNLVAPVEFERSFRLQHLRADVHDPGAAMFGGVAGHAGLFGTAENLAALLQMLLDEGKFNGVQYLDPEVINLFTAYNSSISRRGLGFDKPEKDRTQSRNPYPA